MKTLLEIIDTTNEPNPLMDMDKKAKNIHLSEQAIKTLSIQAVENGCLLLHNN